MTQKIIAIGQHVVLHVTAKSAGKEKVLDSGIIMPAEFQEAELPAVCRVYSIGPDVPPNTLKIGDVVPFPDNMAGSHINCPHPDVQAGLCKAADRDDKFMSTHWRNIACVYA